MKKKNLPIIEGVEITGVAAEGKALVRINDIVCFVPNCVPGDVVDLQVTKKKHSFMEAHVERFVRFAEKRTEAVCPHFGECGGCKWQTLRYEAQLEAKQRQVRDNLERLGNIDCSGMRSICGSENIYYYRNKLEFTFSTRRWRSREELQAQDIDNDAHEGVGDSPCLGFHAPQVFDKVIPIEECLLQQEPSNAIRLFVRDYALSHGLPFYDIRNHTGLLRNIVLRCTSSGQWMVILIVAEDRADLVYPLLDALAGEFPQITSLQYIVNEKLNDSYTDLPSILLSVLAK